MTYVVPAIESKHCSIAPATFTNENQQAEIVNSRCILKKGNYNICLVDSPRHWGMVNRLIKSMYSWRGYETEHATFLSRLPHQLTLEASVGQNIVGTLTIGSDSTDGLLVDALYVEEIMTLRAENRKICELSRLAINPDHGSRELLASLFNLAYIYGRFVAKATDFVIEINPRHAAYYKRLLGFRQIGEIRTCHRVNAPAVLLHLDLNYVEKQVSALAGTRKPGQRSLYTHFITKSEENKVALALEHRIHGRIN